MADRAQVHSIEGIQAFRAHLIVFVDRVRPLLEEANSDIRKTALWLESEQRPYWERRARRCAQELEEAQQILFGARLSGLREATAAEQAAVTKSRNALRDAEDKLRLIKKWHRDLGPQSEELVRQINALDSILSQDLGRAIALLHSFLQSLEAYTEKLPSAPKPAPPPTA